MADTSKAVFQSRESKIRSALVQAFETWKDPVDIRPDGVFGSVATVRSGGVTVSSDTLDIEFRIPFDDDLEPNEAEITIFNLSGNTQNQLKQGAAITVEAGYKGDTGVIFSGFISKVSTTYEGVDKVTTIYALDDIKDHSVQSVSFAEGTSASAILRTLIGLTGIPVAVFKPRRDHTYSDSQNVDGDLMQHIHKYAEVCGISVYVSRGKIYARHIKEGDNLHFNLSPDTGLIGSPGAYTEEIHAADYVDTIDGYKVEMLLQHRMCAGAIVNLQGKAAKGTYRVCKGEHRFSSMESITVATIY